jgi:conjugative transfer signal peptidase TraF
MLRIRWLPRFRVRWRRARRRTTWRDFARLGAVFVLLWVAAVAYHRSGVVLNHTGSMPLGLYHVTRAPRVTSVPVLTHGATVVWCLPQRLGGEARRRGYLGGGSCPGGVESILKVVAAVAGDTVVVDSAGIAVNRRRLPYSRPLTFDSRGRSTTAMPHGWYVVGPAEAWVWSPYTALSFDSRYFGALPIAGLVGIAHPLWTRYQPLPGTPAPDAPPSAAPSGDIRSRLLKR